MLRGIPLSDAMKMVRQDNRPVCLCCGDVILYGTGGRHLFCNKRVECRKMRRRYKYLVYDKGLDKDTALNVVLDKAA